MFFPGFFHLQWCGLPSLTLKTVIFVRFVRLSASHLTAMLRGNRQSLKAFKALQCLKCCSQKLFGNFCEILRILCLLERDVRSLFVQFRVFFFIADDAFRRYTVDKNSSKIFRQFLNRQLGGRTDMNKST